MRPRRPNDPEAVTSRGWRVTESGWDHVIELGLGDVVYLDDRRLVAWSDVPARTDAGLGRSTRVREHAFTLDGRPALVRQTTVISSYPGADVDTSFDLVVDGQRLEGPSQIIGRRDRPAVGTATQRRRRHLSVFMGLLAAGFVYGAIVPLASESSSGDGLLLQLVAYGTLITGLVAVPAAALDTVRRRGATWSRWVLRHLLPFDGGLAVGLAAATWAGVGREAALNNGVIAIAAIAVGTGSVAFGGVALRGAARGRWLPAGSGQALGMLVGWLGLVTFGVGSVAVGVRMLTTGDATGLGVDGLVLLAGFGALMLGGAMVIVESIWRRRSEPEAVTLVPTPAPSGPARQGATSRGPDSPHTLARPRASGPITVVRSPASNGVAERTARAVASLCADPDGVEFVICAGRRGYVQFAPCADGLHGEAVSNAYLEESAVLTPEEDAAIRALGWLAAAPDENYGRTFVEPVDVDEVAELTVETLAAYGDDPAAMEVAAGAV